MSTVVLLVLWVEVAFGIATATDVWVRRRELQLKCYKLLNTSYQARVDVYLG